jgi:xylulokinase
MYSVGLDLGTSSVKALIVDDSSRVVAAAQKDYPSPLITPHPGWVERDPEQFYNVSIDVLKQAVSRLPRTAGDIERLSVSGQVDGVVAVDGRGECLENALTWMDRRATEESRLIEERYDDREIYFRTGVANDASHILPKLLWLMKTHSSRWETVESILPPVSYLIWRFTGQRVIDRTNASYTMVYDPFKDRWWSDIIENFHIGEEKLPKLVDPLESIGPLTDNALLGGAFRRTEVFGGSGDQEAACYGANVMGGNRVLDITGTAEPVCIATDAPVFGSRGLLELHPHVVRGKWLLENPGITSGGCFRWLVRDIFNYTGDGAYRQADRQAQTVPPGSDGLFFLPFMSGATHPEWNPFAKGCFIGLTAKHQRGHLARALMEGTAFVVRGTLEAAGSYGVRPGKIYACAGGAQSDTWMSIKSDVLGTPLRRTGVLEMTAYGAAIMATDREPADLEGEEFRPNPKKAEIYSALYEEFNDLYHSLKGHFDRMETRETKRRA